MSHLLQDANIFVTGGAGTLGRAIARRRKQEGWTGKLTVYSTDDHKHDVMRRMFPDDGIRYVQGDIRNAETLYNAMVGHDVVIHAAAVKVIPVSEEFCIDTVDVNIYGSQTVAMTALRAGISHILGISTDKGCHPANLYGATKMAMEKIFQEFSLAGHNTQFHLVRYGNVLESTGSVIEMWRKALEAGRPIRITDPDMTRFWLSPSQAVDYVIRSFQFPNGYIFVPLMPALAIGKMAAYIIGGGPDFGVERVPLRPGEKMHETLVTVEELDRLHYQDEVEAVVLPSTSGYGLIQSEHSLKEPYTSAVAPELTRDELLKLLDNE
jgi:UDP-N-acetylglucosamine 4,6-dehydratase